MSQDGGKTWGQPKAGLRSDCEYVTSLAMSSDYVDDQTLLLGMVGRGIFKSTDGGLVWLPASAGLTDMRINKILIAPGFSSNQTVFAWLPYQWKEQYIALRMEVTPGRCLMPPHKF